MANSLIEQPFKPKGKGRGPAALTSLSGCITECARIYKAMKRGKMDHSEGRSLVWVLAQLRAMLESQALERIETRLAEMERQNPYARYEGDQSGYAKAVGSVGTTH
jgi:hypothetical protein